MAEQEKVRIRRVGTDGRLVLTEKRTPQSPIPAKVLSKRKMLKNEH
jgi:hypothetical protein